MPFLWLLRVLVHEKLYELLQVVDFYWNRRRIVWRVWFDSFEWWPWGIQWLRERIIVLNNHIWRSVWPSYQVTLDRAMRHTLERYLFGLRVGEAFSLVMALTLFWVQLWPRIFLLDTCDVLLSLFTIWLVWAILATVVAISLQDLWLRKNQLSFVLIILLWVFYLRRWLLLYFLLLGSKAQSRWRAASLPFR